jgi:hypothetical protein
VRHRKPAKGERREGRGIYAPKLVEAGSKTVIGSRLKQSGMFRTVQGANRIIALRCSGISGKFEDCWEQAHTA